MKLRTITIWTTGLMLIVTIIASVCNHATNYFQELNFLTVFSFWLFTGGVPILVSFNIARTLKNATSHLVLFVSTMAYVFLFVYSYYMAFTQDNNDTRFFWLLTMNASFYWMIPAWFVALIFEWRGMKNKKDTRSNGQ